MKEARIKKQSNCIEIDPDKLVIIKGGSYMTGATYLTAVRDSGEFNNKSIVLHDDYNWIVAMDTSDRLPIPILIPLKK